MQPDGPDGPGGLVVVGASLAGLRAVEAARRAGYAGPLTLIGSEKRLPYDRPPLSKQVLELAAEAPDTTFRTEDHLTTDLGARLILGVAAAGLDPDEKSVVLDDGRRIGYDKLIVATGADARRLPGYAGHPRVRVLRTLEDALAVRAAMGSGEAVVVVGCGFIGSEVASALVKHGRPVTLIELAPVPLTRAVGEWAGRYFADLHRDQGVDLRLGCKIETLEDVEDGVRLHLSDGTVCEASLVVLGLGAVPATAWMESSGVVRAADGSLLADRYLRTSLPDVFAAGDVVTWENGLFSRGMRLEHWTSAAEQAAVAARNAVANDEPEAYETVPYFWSDLYGKRVQFVGVHGTDEPIAFADDRSRVVLYRDGGVLAGALTVAQPRLTMKLRKIVAEHGAVESAKELVTAQGLTGI